MAIPWAVLVSRIPWRTLISASPDIVRGAKKLYRSVKQEGDDRPAPSLTPEPGGSDAEKIKELEEGLFALEGRLNELGEQQKSAAELINALAEQNAQVVKAIDVLRVRTRFLMYACGALGVALVALGIWVALA